MASKQPAPPPFVEVSKRYINNPFFIATNGMQLLFKHAKNVAILLLLLSIAGAIGQSEFSRYTNDASNSSAIENYFTSLEPSQLVTLVVSSVLISMAILVVSIMVSGINGYVAARASKGQSTSLNEAFNAVLARFGSYTWVYILMNVKIFLWTLLFIIPGVIMAIRYSLSSAVFFDQSNTLKGNDVLKKSSQLVKGSWITTFASYGLFNIITLGWISYFINASVLASLYGQYTDINRTGAKKPKAHWLSWIVLVLPFVLFLAAILLLIAAYAVLSTGGFS